MDVLRRNGLEHCDMLCTRASGLIDDVTFSYNGPYRTPGWNLTSATALLYYVTMFDGYICNHCVNLIH